MTRSELREHSFRILFSSEFLSETGMDELIRQYLENFAEEELTENDISFIRSEVEGTLTHLEEIDPKISSVLKGWTMERISREDRAILRMALFEMDHWKKQDIPASVSISEAVELAKKYSPNETGAFVNGVLANFAKDAPRKNETKKKPREKAE
ncbi:MAG: transcription antitermination factor NusB [Lachnospiraceae bacterium]|nr:transcription antitermination factor NusB [Lachnospiraceae bacterium]